jgi:hypothetical protein
MWTYVIVTGARTADGGVGQMFGGKKPVLRRNTFPAPVATTSIRCWARREDRGIAQSASADHYWGHVRGTHSDPLGLAEPLSMVADEITIPTSQSDGAVCVLPSKSGKAGERSGVFDRLENSNS